MTEEFTQRSNVSSNRLAGAKPVPGSERNRSRIDRTAFAVPVETDVTVDGSSAPLAAIPAFEARQAAGAGGR